MTELFESYLKHIQQVSDLDNFIKQFNHIEVVDFDDFDTGLTKYDNIPYDTAYVFAYPS